MFSVSWQSKKLQTSEPSSGDFQNYSAGLSSMINSIWPVDGISVISVSYFLYKRLSVFNLLHKSLQVFRTKQSHVGNFWPKMSNLETLSSFPPQFESLRSLEIRPDTSQFFYYFYAKSSELVNSQVCVSKNTSVNRSQCFDPNFYWESTVLPRQLGSKHHDQLTIVIFIHVGLWTYKFAQFIALPPKICCFCWKLNHLF